MSVLRIAYTLVCVRYGRTVETVTEGFMSSLVLPRLLIVGQSMSTEQRRNMSLWAHDLGSVDEVLLNQSTLLWSYQ